MNRKEKRITEKILKAKDYSPEQIERLIATKELIKNSIIIPEGQKVKLNIKSIKDDVNYPRLTDKYKQWVDGHVDDVFTVEYDINHKVNTSLVCLAEDKTEPKWLFWTGNLTIIASENNDSIN